MRYEAINLTSVFALTSRFIGKKTQKIWMLIFSRKLFGEHLQIDLQIQLNICLHMDGWTIFGPNNNKICQTPMTE